MAVQISKKRKVSAILSPFYSHRQTFDIEMV
ncbi:hypothetical protein EYF80_065027 [Liparis tanakae]|uniref:Uncharacterized protein n=1 Tax=Liparis tanakae TaxID=230148 RepID=A0A4Z2E7S6_9TELE|nr:hypothetical protein EYF80_065027 [Liparis tanakae]